MIRGSNRSGSKYETETSQLLWLRLESEPPPPDTAVTVVVAAAGSGAPIEVVDLTPPPREQQPQPQQSRHRRKNSDDSKKSSKGGKGVAFHIVDRDDRDNDHAETAWLVPAKTTRRSYGGGGGGGGESYSGGESRAAAVVVVEQEEKENGQTKKAQPKTKTKPRVNDNVASSMDNPNTVDHKSSDDNDNIGTISNHYHDQVATAVELLWLGTAAKDNNEDNTINNSGGVVSSPPPPAVNTNQRNRMRNAEKYDETWMDGTAAAETILQTCGPLPTLSATVTVLKDLKKKNNNKVNQQADTDTSTASPTPLTTGQSWSILQLSLQTLQLLLFPSTENRNPASQDDDDDDENSQDDTTTGSLLPHLDPHFKPTITPTERSSIWSFGCAENDNGGKAHNSCPSLFTLSSSSWILPTILTLPNVIAEACTAMGIQDGLPRNNHHHQHHPLLKVLACRKIYHRRLIEAAIVVTSATTATTAAAATVQQPVVPWLLHALVQHLLRRCHGRDVAVGLYQCYQNIQPPGQPQNVSDAATTTATARSASIRRLLASVAVPLSAQEASILCRAILQHSVDRNDAGAPTPKQHPPDDWIDLVCGPIVRCHGDSVCRWIVLSSSLSSSSSSSVTATTKPKAGGGANCRRLLCHALAKLLRRTTIATITTTTTLNNSDYDENEDSEDDDDDDADWKLVPETDRLLYRCLCQVALTWSQTTFVRQTDFRMQQHVTGFLLSGLSLLTTASTTAADHNNDRRNSGTPVEFTALGDSNILTVRIMEGVTIRLGSQLPSIRKDGMLVAELLSQKLLLFLGQEELKFEELTDDDRNDAFGWMVSTVPKVPTAPGTHINSNIELKDDTKYDKEKLQQARTQKTANTKSKKLRLNSLDPDAENPRSDDEVSRQSTQDGEDDSDWDNSKSALTPYDLDDDQDDLRETPRPLYLCECLDYLRTPETDERIFSRHEAALQELSRLVRSRPADLADSGPELARNVLRLENKFGMERFAELVSDALCSLVVEDPLAVGTNLIAEIFQDGSLTDRLTVLHALDEAALELSGYKQLEQKEVEGLEVL